MATRLILAFVLVMLTMATSRYHTANYEIDPEYAIRFNGSGAEGTFGGLTGDITFDPADLPNAHMSVRVKAATIATGNDLKDQHARGDNWFDVENYPAITYEATDFERTETGYVANGTLTLHGVSEAKPLPFTFTKTPQGGRFEGRMTVDREAFGIEGPWLAFTVGDEFEVELIVPVR